MAIIASLAVPNILRQIDQAKASREKSDLKTLADALARSILRTKSIPLPASMTDAMARECALPPAQIRTTPIGTQRAILLDPNLQIGSGLPYIQSGNLGLAQRPSATRLVLISSLSRPDPLTAEETAATPANFESIWNTSEDGRPAAWTRWKGRGNDLRIERLTLAPLFRRLILVNRDPSKDPRFNLDHANPDALTNGVWEAYYLQGSVVGLYLGGDLQTRHMLTEDISLVFENGMWRGGIGRGSTSVGLPDAFTSSAKRFLEAPWNRNAQQGASQLPILTALYTFMLNYAMWANGCPHFNYHGNLPVNNPGNVPEYRMLNDLGRQNGLIDDFTGSGGLLK